MKPDGGPTSQSGRVGGQPRSTLSQDYQRPWPAYFDAVAGKPPRETVLRALGAFDAERGVDAGGTGGKGRESEGWVAIDVACGEGRDTRAIVRHGADWRVIAVDSSVEGLRRLEASLGGEERGRVRAVLAGMEELAAGVLGVGARDAALVNASFALPFCEPGQFGALWAWIGRVLRDGGRFCGQFFGDRDEWYAIRPGSHVTRARLEQLLDGWAVEHLEEVEKDGDDAMGGLKHHHVFHVVARKVGRAER